MQEHQCSYPLSTFNIANNAGTPVITALDSGNVGIGTASPKTKLDVENTTAPTLSNDTHAGEAIFLRSGGSAGDGNVQGVLAFGKADGSSRRSGSAIASVQTDSDVDKVGIGFYTSVLLHHKQWTKECYLTILVMSVYKIHHQLEI